MRVLITGAAGFVGRWLTDAFRRDGMAVTALATEPSAVVASHRLNEHTAPIEWMFGDLRSDDYVNAVVNAARPDYVVHLAAISHLPTAVADPALAWDINVTATARLLHAVGRARDAGNGDPTVLIVGSGEQYGRHDDVDIPLVETAPLFPRTVYAATKAAQEVLALQQWRATGLRVVVARSFNHSGPGQESRFLLPALVARAVALRSAPAGTPLLLGNTTPVRDFLHVSDVVAAYILLCQRGAPGEVYNVASGDGYSVAAIVERVLRRAQVSATLAEDPALVRPVDVPSLVGNSLKLQLTTGWRATRTFDDIIDDLLHAATH